MLEESDLLAIGGPYHDRQGRRALEVVGTLPLGSTELTELGKRS